MPTKEEVAKQRALDCRKIRMFIANNPPHTMDQIMKRTGIADETLFWKMEGMGIIERNEHHDCRKDSTWRVVPQ